MKRSPHASLVLWATALSSRANALLAPRGQLRAPTMRLQAIDVVAFTRDLRVRRPARTHRQRAKESSKQEGWRRRRGVVASTPRSGRVDAAERGARFPRGAAQPQKERRGAVQALAAVDDDS